MERTQELVTYDGLPAAAGGAHALRIRQPERALAAWDRFLAACLLPETPPEWGMRLLRAGQDADAVSAARAAEETVSATLGGPSARQRALVEWRLPAERLGDALQLLAAASPAAGSAAPASRGQLAITVRASGGLIDPGTGARYPDLSAEHCGGFAVDGYGRKLGVSGLRGTFAAGSSKLSMWLVFPADERLRGAARHVQEHAPVPLSAKHWRRWTLTRTGSGYRSAKLVSPLVSDSTAQSKTVAPPVA